MAQSRQQQIRMMELKIAIKEKELELAKAIEAESNMGGEDLLAGVDLPSGDMTPIEEDELNYQQRVKPIQDIAKEARVDEAASRQARRRFPDLEIEVPNTEEYDEEGVMKQEAEKRKGLSLVEKAEDLLFTEDVMDDPEGSGPGDEIIGALSLPARALGAVFMQGDITEESTKILKPAIESLNKWADDPDNEGLSTDVAQALGNIALETASDPFAIGGVGKQAIKSTLKALGKSVTTKQLDNLYSSLVKQSEDKISKAGRKRLRASDIKAEKALVESGGGEAVMKRLEDMGIGISSKGELNIPQKTIDDNIKKLQAKPIAEFDATDAIEATVVPIKKKSFLAEALRGNVTEDTNLNVLVKGIMSAGDNSKQISKLLRDAGWDNPSKVSGIFARTGESITGAEARDFIAELNAATKGKNVTGSQQGLNKIRLAIESRLKKAVGKDVPDDALEDYIQMREIGTEKYVTKTGKLRNILKRKGDKTLDRKASTDAMYSMMRNAMDEVATGTKGLAFKNLEEIDEIAGTNFAPMADDLGMAERFQLDIKGGITAKPTQLKAPLKGSVAQKGAIAGGPGATQQAVQNTIADAVNSMNLKQTRKLIDAMFKEKSKLKIAKDDIMKAKRDVAAGKKLLIEQVNKGRGLKTIDLLTSKGVVTVKQMVQSLGKDSSLDLAEEAMKSNDPKIRSLGKRLKVNAEKL